MKLLFGNCFNFRCDFIDFNFKFSASAKHRNFRLTTNRIAEIYHETYNDIIGVYRFGEDEPFKLLNVTVEKLPKNDISALNSGIEIFTDDELFFIDRGF